ncbi:MAG: hypothetical protein FJX36_10440 [Alphaproteobacteria bacterium]|nr:hypothetical protein [Alphaproteobacteria bacterium]
MTSERDAARPRLARVRGRVLARLGRDAGAQQPHGRGLGRDLGHRAHLAARARHRRRLPRDVRRGRAGRRTLPRDYPSVHRALTWIGAAYMLWLAWRIATARPAPRRDGDDTAAAPAPTPARGRPLSFVEGALFQWVNPKAWIIVMGAIATYTEASAMLAQAAVMAVTFFLVTVPSCLLWTRDRRRRRASPAHGTELARVQHRHGRAAGRQPGADRRGVNGGLNPPGAAPGPRACPRGWPCRPRPRPPCARPGGRRGCSRSSGSAG